MAALFVYRSGSMNNDLLNLLMKAILFACANIGLRLFLKQPLVSASLAFWFGWIFLITGGLVAISEGWANISTRSAPYIGTLFNGAFTGFLLATFLNLTPKSPPKYVHIVEISKVFFSKFGQKVLLVLFLLGTIFFLQRLATVGLSSDYLSEVREIYNQRSGSMLLRLGSHLSVLMTMFIILRGMYDSYYGVNLRMLVLTILCGAPLGLANGGRMFLLSYTLAYIASLFLSRSHFSSRRFILTKREFLALGSVVSGALIIFAIMGYLRGGYGEELNIFYTVLVWPVSTLNALDSWVFSAEISERTYGLNTFGWVFDFFSRLGLLDFSSVSEIMQRIIYHFQYANNSAAVIPRSILPDLIFDFGPGAVFSGMMIVALFLEIITDRYTGRGIFLHVLAVQCLVAAFATIQNSVITPGFAVAIFYAGLFSIVAKHYKWSR